MKVYVKAMSNKDINHHEEDSAIDVKLKNQKIEGDSSVEDKFVTIHNLDKINEVFENHKTSYETNRN